MPRISNLGVHEMRAFTDSPSHSLVGLPTLDFAKFCGYYCELDSSNAPVGSLVWIELSYVTGFAFSKTAGV